MTSFRLITALAALLLFPLAASAHSEGVHDIVTVTPTHIQAQYDKPPRFCATPTARSTKNGTWSDPTTWSTGQVPGADAKILIAPATTVTVDVQSDTKLDCIEVEGTLTFNPATSTRLVLNNLQVMPEGTLNINYRTSTKTAEIIIRDTPLATTTIDPQQFGQALMAFGEVHLEGNPLDKTFIRLAQEPQAGATTLTLETAPTGWKVGSTVALPDSRQLHPGDVTDLNRPFPKVAQSETAIIKTIAGSVITLEQPLQYAHPGARDMNGHLDFLPHVALLTRNVTIRSENPNGTRGHIMMMARAHPVIRYVALQDLGRTTVEPLNSTTFNMDGTVATIGTNQIGRYMLHFHHDWGPSVPDPSGYQFEAVGNALNGGRRWGLTVHASHYGLIQDNVVYGAPGAGIVTEDGSETENQFIGNFVLNSIGSTIGNRGGPDVGFNGTCYWQRASNNVYRNNVAAACVLGFDLFNGGGVMTVKVPTAPGQDPRTSGTSVNGQALSRTKYVKNRSGTEVYGIYNTGFLLWGGPQPFVKTGQDGDTVAWHVYQMVFKGGTAAQADPTIKGLTVRLAYDPAKANNEKYALVEKFTNTYQKTAVFEDANLQGASTIFRNLPVLSLTLKNAYVRSHDITFDFVNTRDENQVVIFDNVKIDPAASQPLKTINWRFVVTPSPPKANLAKFNANVLKRFLVYNFNQIPGNNFELFNVEQAPGFIIPPKRIKNDDDFSGCPAGDGLTNADCYARSGTAIGGRPAPCATPDCAAEVARAAELGITAALFPFTGGEPPPPPSTPPQLLITNPGNLSSRVVPVRYAVTGDQREVNHVHLQLDTNPEVRDLDFDGRHTFMNVPFGTHTLKGYLARADHSRIGDVVPVPPLTFTTTDPSTGTGPTIDVTADRFTIRRGESLTIPFIVRGAATFTGVNLEHTRGARLRKKDRPNMSPTPTPDSSPSPTPSPDLMTTPTVSPELSPTPTPSPEVSPTPATSAEPSPSPTL